MWGLDRPGAGIEYLDFLGAYEIGCDRFGREKAA